MFAFATPLSTFSGNFTTNARSVLQGRTSPRVLPSKARHVKPASIVTRASATQLEDMTLEKFWSYADESKVNTQYESDKKIAFLKDASFEDVKRVCIQYRYFVERYPSFLSHLVAKLPYGTLRSLMADILSEELGSGKQNAAHIVWYDSFLRSLGVTDEELKTSVYPENDQILLEIEKRCLGMQHEYVVGMVGMGGECLCQIYLTNMYKYLSENAAVKAMGKKIDWTFWTYHIGEEDIKHRLMVREAINGAAVDKDGTKELFKGYSWGKSTWDDFWSNNYKETQMRTKEYARAE